MNNSFSEVNNFFELPSLRCANDVIEIVKTGNLFLHQYNSAQRQIQHFTGEATLSSAAINNFVENVSYSHNFCHERDIRYQHIVFPAKPIAFASEFKEAGVELTSLMTKQHYQGSVIYPIEQLASQEHFYRQDTHLNDFGKLAIMEMILRKLGYTLPKFSPRYGTRNLVGDLGGKLSLEAVPETTISELRPGEVAKKSFSTATFLSGNAGQISYHINFNSIFKQRLVLFGDSFIQAFLGLFSSLFHEVVYMRCPHVRGDITDLLAPDLVLTSNAERYLVNVPNHKTNPPYFLHYFNSGFRPSEIEDVTRNAFKALFSGPKSTAYLHWYSQMKRQYNSQS